MAPRANTIALPLCESVSIQCAYNMQIASNSMQLKPANCTDVRAIMQNVLTVSFQNYYEICTFRVTGLIKKKI